MRRSVAVALVLAGVLGAAACEPLRDAFSARVDVVAVAGDETLTVERLSQLAGLGKQVPVQQEAIRRLALVWVDYALFAQAIADGRPLGDSTTVAQAMWPAIAQLKWERYHDALIADRAALNPTALDSAYATGELRLFQHILLRASQSEAPQVVAEKERRLRGILADARRDGARFATLAARWSEDPGSKERGGLLGVAGHGSYVAPFEDAAWALEPGEISDVVRTPFGVHIIRRPPLAEVRDSFRLGLEERRAFAFDSAFVDSLSRAARLRVTGSAPALARQAVENFDAARANNATLASYANGRFRVRDLARWLSAMDPQVAQGIVGAADSQITQFVRVLAERQLLLDAAHRAGTALSGDDWAYLRAVHDSALHTLVNIFGLDTATLAATTGPDTRQRVAMAKVNDYLDRVVAGRAQFIPIPPFLSEALRSGTRWRLYNAGVRRGLERAQQLRATADSMAAGGEPQPNVMTPAPGPAPVPGADAGR
jgi:hypothetical protein